jgi:hypothetical protein
LKLLELQKEANWHIPLVNKVLSIAEMAYCPQLGPITGFAWVLARQGI